ncbi:MAG: hypothetical protein ACPL1G_07630 [Thermodesulfovibrionales bacterium]
MIFNKDAIKTFVQQTLGCGCPEKVFEYIDCQSDIRLDEIVLKNKINIGNRLLLYIVEIDDKSSLKSIIPFLVKAGKEERDKLNFNRFRLVLVTDKLNYLKEAAETIFETIPKDEKVHLHVVDINDIPKGMWR